MSGFISLHRDIQKHWLYEDDRVFSKYEAWLDILMRVNHTEGKTNHNGTLETILRGSTIWSKGDMEKHWKWSNSKVTAFLKRLESEEMIKVNSTTKKTYLTVVNYEKYQYSGDGKTPPKRHQNATETPPKHTKDNVNKDKEEELKPIVADITFDQFWDVYPSQTGKAKAKVKWNEYLKKGIIDIEHILKQVEAYKEYVESERKRGFQLQYMNGQTFVNGKRWDDSFNITAPTSKKESKGLVLTEEYDGNQDYPDIEPAKTSKLKDPEGLYLF